jgi:hypothetical protein
MAQEFFIKSDQLEQKVRELLPSQGGAGAGFDLSATTQIVPIIDLTESAEGSNLRQDLQTAASTNCSNFTVENTTTTLVSNTGFFLLRGTVTGFTDGSTRTATIQLNNTSGSAKTPIYISKYPVNSSNLPIDNNFELIVCIGAGFTLEGKTDAANLILSVTLHNIASVDGILTNPAGFTTT